MIEVFEPQLRVYPLILKGIKTFLSVPRETH